MAAQQSGPQAQARSREVLHVAVVNQSGEEEEEEEQEEHEERHAVVLLQTLRCWVSAVGERLFGQEPDGAAGGRG